MCPACKRYRSLLVEVRTKLNLFADQSERGGWSTHQVRPQRELAAQIQRELDRVPAMEHGENCGCERTEVRSTTTE